MTAVDTSIDLPHLTFSVGIPGFPDAHTFVLFNNELAQEPFSIMRCVEDQELEFVVVPPHLFYPDYAPEIDDATAKRLALESADDALLLVMLTVGDEAADITANLMGPVVINRKTNSAAQAVLSGQSYELCVPLFSEEILEAFKSETESA